MQLETGLNSIQYRLAAFNSFIFRYLINPCRILAEQMWQWQTLPQCGMLVQVRFPLLHYTYQLRYLLGLCSYSFNTSNLPLRSSYLFS